MLAALVALAIVLGPGGARAAPAGRDGQIPESSRWLSFVRLVSARWTVRVKSQPGDVDAMRRLYAQCIDDAWYLALGELLARGGACDLLLEASPGSDAEPSRALREEYRQLIDARLVTPDRARFRDCARAAYTRRDAALLRICARALQPRAVLTASVPDAERFQNWLKPCKRALLGDLAPGTAGSTDGGARLAARHSDVGDDDHARHCLRSLPSLYEVQQLSKIGDFWTPEERRALHQRARQLAGD